jgi:hypothetical protein
LNQTLITSKILKLKFLFLLKILNKLMQMFNDQTFNHRFLFLINFIINQNNRNIHNIFQIFHLFLTKLHNKFVRDTLIINKLKKFIQFLVFGFLHKSIYQNYMIIYNFRFVQTSYVAGNL